MFDCMQLASGFHIHILKLAALIERILFKHFKTCREGNASKTPAVTECTPTNALQIGAFLKAYAPEVLVAVEAESADMGDAITDYQRSDRCGFILDDPHRIVTIGCVILHNAFAANLKCAVGQKDIIQIGAGEAGVHNGSIRRGNKFALFAEGTGVAPDFHIAADGIAVLVKEVSSGESIDFACHFKTCCKVHILADRFVVVEPAELCLACANAVIAEIVIVAVDLLQTGQLHAVAIVGLADPAVRNNNTVDIGFAVGPYTIEQLAAGALQNAVHKAIAVTGCGNGGAPIHDGVTYLAEGTSGVTGLGAGGCLVSKNGFCMLMPRSNSQYSAFIPFVDTDIAFSAHGLAVYLNLFRREGSPCSVSEKDASGFRQKLNIHRIYTFLHCDYPVRIFFQNIMGIPCTYRNGDYNTLPAHGRIRNTSSI